MEQLAKKSTADQPPPFICFLKNSSNILGTELTILNDEASLSNVLKAGDGRLLAYERQAFSKLGFQKGDKVSDFVLFEVNMVKLISSMFWYTKMEQVCVPRLIVFKKTTSVSAIRAMVREHVGRRLPKNIDKLPYKLMILNTLEHDVPCEFCKGTIHNAANCPFKFDDKNEDELTIEQVLNMVNNDTRPELQLVIEFDDSLDKQTLQGFDQLLECSKKTVQNHTDDFKRKSGQFYLQDCFEAFQREEMLTGQNKWYCTKCKDNVGALKQMRICRLPKYLLIHLKRFK